MIRRVLTWLAVLLLALTVVPAVAFAAQESPAAELNVILDVVLGAVATVLTALFSFMLGKATGYHDKLKAAASKGEAYLKAAENNFFELIADFKPVYIALAAVGVPWLSAQLGVDLNVDAIANAPLITGFAVTIRELWKRYGAPLLGKLLKF